MTKRKNVTGYMAIEENGIEVWPKAFVEAVYLACSEEVQRLKDVGTEKVIKMIPKCEKCKSRELPCKLKTGLRTDRMSCSNCSSTKPCSRPADYMWKTLGATWTEYSVTPDQFRYWYPKVMTPKSIYVIKDSGDRPISEVTGRKGGKASKNKSRGPDSDEDEVEDKEGDGDRDGGKEEEEDEQGVDQDPLPSTSRKHSQDSLRAASTQDRKLWSQKPAESPTPDLQLTAENRRLKKELELAESENERLRTRLLEFEKTVGEFKEDAMEKQIDIARFKQGSAALYSILDASHGQNEDFRQRLTHLMNDSMFLRLRLDVDGQPESQLHKDMNNMLREMAVRVLHLPGPVWTTAEKERIEKTFNPAEGSSGTKRSGGDLEEESESRRKRARMLLTGKSVERVGDRKSVV